MLLALPWGLLLLMPLLLLQMPSGLLWPQPVQANTLSVRGHSGITPGAALQAPELSHPEHLLMVTLPPSWPNTDAPA